MRLVSSICLSFRLLRARGCSSFGLSAEMISRTVGLLHISLAALLLAASATSLPAAAEVFRVKADSAAPTPDGTSWEDAFSDIQSAVDAASGAGGGEVWVAQGTYVATSDNVVSLAPAVDLYGGFVGTETAREERDWEIHETIIDGEGARRGVLGAADATLDGFTITGGRACLGPGMYNVSCSPTVANCVFRGNVLGFSIYDYSYGGGMCNDASSPSLANCTFTGNTSSGAYNFFGGGMYNKNSSSPSLTDCAFTNNSAARGAGMYNEASSPSLTNCAFTGNGTSEYGIGGGMFNDSSSPVLVGCTFTDNHARHYGQGGGMYSRYSSMPSLDNCTFTDNTAMQGGGMQNESSSATLRNCTFTNNRASGMDAFGGGVYNSSSSLSAINCVFVRNAATRGGGLNNDSGSATLTNCAFAGNTVSWEGATGGGVCNDSASLALVNCVIWGNTTGLEGSGEISPTAKYSCIQGGYAGDGNIDADPMFWNAPGADLRLHPSSPCLNSGTATDAPSNDIRGVARPQGGRVDMGAYEMNEVDSDGDGLMDGFETIYSHTDPHDPDSDGDGTDDGDAWFSGDFGVWHVDAASTTAAPDGATWDSAFTDIQSGVDAAEAAGGGEVWVAEGVYTGTADPVLTMKPGVWLYGGFSATEIVRDGRNWTAHITAIDGEDARRAVNGADDAGLDGFVIERGSALSGAGMYNSLCSPAVTNCTFTENATTSSGNGGALYNASSSPTLTNCVLSQNTANVGGALYNASSSPAVTNCTFAENAAASSGGAMYNDASSPTAMNCILWGDTAPNGPEICSSGLSAPAISYSCIQGGYGGEHNIDDAPVFVGAPDNLQLQPGSPCFDTGTTAGAPATDIHGAVRPQGTGVDMGAYEGDSYGLYAPLVSGTPSPTADSTPTWTWTSGGSAGQGLYRYGRAEGIWDVVNTTTTSYTSEASLLDGAYRLYVQERDADGHWSASGTYAILVDAEPPIAIVVPPQGGRIEVGTDFLFIVTATGGWGTLSYQWKKDGAPIIDATGPVYDIVDAVIGDSGNYTVEISDVTGDIIEPLPARLTVVLEMPTTGVAGLLSLTAALVAAALRRRLGQSAPSRPRQPRQASR